ncbi:putative repeat protein (TIGR01451 family) [Catellatospora citrea]|nr:putative repeat protein (TIGR01451 family) [Catellatospora citrea]
MKRALTRINQTGDTVSRRHLLSAGAVLAMTSAFAIGATPGSASAAPGPSGRLKATSSAKAAPGQGSGTATRAEVPLPVDLRITKEATPDPVYAGQELTYTIFVTNEGLTTATGVTVTDTLPAGVQLLSSTPACTGTTVLTCPVGPMGVLLPGQTVPLVIQVGLPADFQPRSITNEATVAAAERDIDPGDNTATAITVVKRLADLAVTKVCKPDVPAPAGTQGFCDIYVDNLGPSEAVAVELTDVLTSAAPFQLVGVRLLAPDTCLPTSSGPVTRLVIECDLGTIPAGDRKVVRVTVSADDVSQVNDVATVQSLTKDPDGSNNKATGRLDFVGSADLSLDKTGPARVLAGTQLTYEIKVTNGGPSTANDVSVRDTLPAGVSFVSATSTSGTCTNGQPTARDLVCGLGDLPKGGTATVTVVGLVASDVVPGTRLFNEAVVSSATADKDNNDVRDSVPTDVTASADLSVTKTDSPASVLAGNKLTYTLTAANAGPSDAQVTVLTDTLPAGTSYVSGVDGNDATVCTFVQPNQVICALGVLQPGQTKKVYLTVLVAPSVATGTTLTNTVKISSATPDPTPGNDTATETTQVTTSAELWIDKTGTVTSKDKRTATFILTVHNDKGCETDTVSTPQPNCGEGGPSDAQNLVVVDQLPLKSKEVEVEYVSPQCSYAKETHTVTCTATTLPAGAKAAFEIRVKFKDDCKIENTATVKSSTPDPVLTNNTNTIKLAVKK